MLQNKKFYGVIIGSEILQNRREDAHFKFLRDALLQRNYELYSISILKDDAKLIQATFEHIKQDPHAILFSFGGIGSTPDDLTRDIASKVFTQKAPLRHKTFERDIIERFGDAAYPFRIHMADIPEGSQLLHNPVNNMSGFHLNNRYFFVPGFPEMAHPMILEALNTYFPIQKKPHKTSLLIQTSEDKLIPFMQTLHPEIELSCLPMMIDGKPHAEITLQTQEKVLLDTSINALILFIQTHQYPYEKL